MQQYMCLIYSDGEYEQSLDQAAQQAYMGEYFAFNKAIGSALLGGEALPGPETARSVRVRDGKTLVTDGPYAETKEFLGGYYLVQAESLAQAQAIAARIPAAKHGTIEVREVLKFG